jgi:hypothetical protein
LLVFCSPLEKIKPFRCKLFTPRNHYRVLALLTLSFVSLRHGDTQYLCALVLSKVPFRDLTPVSSQPDDEVSGIKSCNSQGSFTLLQTCVSA